MAESQAVWGIDIGQAGLKAVRLKYAEAAGQVLAVAFDYVPHPKILSQPDAIPDELINQALEKFLSRNDVKGDRVAISVPGQTALTRFIQLPPVESGKVAEIVKYEAKQQIPFALEDVCWQWQKLGGGVEESGYMLEAEVGLFAMKRDQVQQHLRPFLDHQIEVDLVQIAPLALYNFLSYDRLGVRPGEESPSEDEHTIILDMGADNTTLMVSDGQKIWIRNVPIGGNHFTRALTKEMKLTFAKAEHLKINATKAPDPRAVFQALRPVFNDYVSEIQRSIGYFSSVNRNAKIGKVLGVGNGFKLAGLQKFLHQNLQYEVERVDSFQALVGDSVLSSKLFDENILSFAVPYGLALQGLELTRIHVDLLPEEIRVERMIRQKKPWACVAAASLLVGMALSAVGYANAYSKVAHDHKPWNNAIKEAKDSASLAASNKTAYGEKTTAFEEQKKKNDRLIAAKEGKSIWLEMRKAWAECLPRDKVDSFKPNEIAKRNRMKVWKYVPKFYPDLSVWWESRKALAKGYLRDEDRLNPPKGPGWVVTLEVVHHHAEGKFNKDGRLIIDKESSYGAVYVWKTFIANLQRWQVSQQSPEPTGPVPVRELGITHPIIVNQPRPKWFKYVLDTRKVSKAGNAASGADGMNRNGYDRPDSSGMPPDGIGSGMGKSKPNQPPERDENLIEIPLSQCTVEFVWQPPTPEQRAVFNALHQYFSLNPPKPKAKGDESPQNEKWSYNASKEFVEKKIDAANTGLEYKQEHYDEYVKKHFAPAAPKQSEDSGE